MIRTDSETRVKSCSSSTLLEIVIDEVTRRVSYFLFVSYPDVSCVRISLRVSYSRSRHLFRFRRSRSTATALILLTFWCFTHHKIRSLHSSLDFFTMGHELSSTDGRILWFRRFLWRFHLILLKSSNDIIVIASFYCYPIKRSDHFFRFGSHSDLFLRNLLLDAPGNTSGSDGVQFVQRVCTWNTKRLVIWTRLYDHDRHSDWLSFVLESISFHVVHLISDSFNSGDDGHKRWKLKLIWRITKKRAKSFCGESFALWSCFFENIIWIEYKKVKNVKLHFM